MSQIDAKHGASITDLSQVRARKLLDAARPELQRLLPEAVAGGAAVAFFVTDPRQPAAEPDPTDPEARAEWAELVKIAEGKPLVAVIATPVIVKLLANLEEDSGVAEIIRRITVDRDLAKVPIVYQFGQFFGMVEIDPVAPRSSANVLDDGRGGYLLNVGAVLVMLHGTDPQEVKDGPGRDRVRLFRQRAAQLLAAENIRAKPRALAAVLLAGFGGKARLEDALKTRGIDGLLEQIDRVLAS